jgi:hypothetical protein
LSYRAAISRGYFVGAGDAAGLVAAGFADDDGLAEAAGLVAAAGLAEVFGVSVSTGMAAPSTWTRSRTA